MRPDIVHFAIQFFLSPSTHTVPSHLSPPSCPFPFLPFFCREELQQPAFSAMDAIEFPELHDESIPVVTFIRHLARLLNASGVREFGLRDLHKPEAPRLKRNLSAVINFAKFREEKLEAYTALTEELEALVAARDRFATEKAALTAELATLRQQREAELPEVEKLYGDRDALVAENQKLNKDQATLSSNVRKLKQEANTLAEDSNNFRQKISAAKSEEDNLRERVVHSPEKVRARLDEISNAVDMERRALKDAEDRSRDLATKLEGIARAEKEVQRAVSLMTSAEEAISHKKEANRKVKDLKAAIAATEHEATQLAAKRQHLARQQASLLERITRLESQVAMRKDAVESTIEERIRDKEVAEAENAAAAAKIAENDALARSLRERIAELRAAHDMSITAVLDKWDSLCSSVRMYHAEMEAAMVQQRNNSNNENENGGKRGGHLMMVR